MFEGATLNLTGSFAVFGFISMMVTTVLFSHYFAVIIKSIVDRMINK